MFAGTKVVGANMCYRIRHLCIFYIFEAYTHREKEGIFRVSSNQGVPL